MTKRKEDDKPKMGRPTRAATAATRFVTLRLTDTEHAAWLARAGARPLAQWIRERVNGGR